MGSMNKTSYSSFPDVIYACGFTRGVDRLGQNRREVRIYTQPHQMAAWAYTNRHRADLEVVVYPRSGAVDMSRNITDILSQAGSGRDAAQVRRAITRALKTVN